MACITPPIRVISQHDSFQKLIHSSKTELSLATLVIYLKNEWDSDKGEADNNIP